MITTRTRKSVEANAYPYAKRASRQDQSRSLKCLFRKCPQSRTTAIETMKMLLVKRRSWSGREGLWLVCDWCPQKFHLLGAGFCCPTLLVDTTFSLSFSEPTKTLSKQKHTVLLQHTTQKVSSVFNVPERDRAFYVSFPPLSFFTSHVFCVLISW